jgi:putative FmdB family regulatory protein
MNPMPTYVYECAKCGDELEVWQSFEDEPLKRHRGGCGGKLTKVLQPVGILLKGPGFYKTDSREAGKHNGKGKADHAESGGSGEAKESKSGSEKSGSEKSGSEKSGSEKSGSEKSGSEKSGSEKKRDPKSESKRESTKASTKAPSST